MSRRIMHNNKLPKINCETQKQSNLANGTLLREMTIGHYFDSPKWTLIWKINAKTRNELQSLFFFDQH